MRHALFHIVNCESLVWFSLLGALVVHTERNNVIVENLPLAVVMVSLNVILSSLDGTNIQD